MNGRRADEAHERRLEQALAELGGEQPAPLVRELVRRDAAAMARAAARLDAARRPALGVWAVVVAAAALMVVTGVWWSGQSRSRADGFAQEPTRLPPPVDLAGLLAHIPQLRGALVAATGHPDGRRFAPGPEREIALAEPAVVAALRTALAGAKQTGAMPPTTAAWTGRATFWFGTGSVDAAFTIADGFLTLRLPRGTVVTALGPAADAMTAALQDSATATVPARRRIPVATALEFARALGSDRTIEITTTEPLLLDDAFVDGVAPASSPLQLGGDGPEPSPMLSGLRNLHVRGLHGKATLLVRSALADVLRLHDCVGVVLEDVVLGHLTPNQPCQAPVLTVRGGKDLLLLRCELFGCGALGLDAADTGAVHLLGSRVHTCSVAVMQVRRSGALRCELCTFEDCQLWSPAIELVNTSATFTACRLTGMKQQTRTALFLVDGRPMTWRGGAIVDNVVQGLGGGSLQIEAAEVARNGR